MNRNEHNALAQSLRIAAHQLANVAQQFAQTPAGEAASSACDAVDVLRNRLDEVYAQQFDDEPPYIRAGMEYSR